MGIEYVGYDLNCGKLPFDSNRFDVVVSTEVLEHLGAPFMILSEIVRVLRPGGLLCITIPNYWNIRYRVRYLLTGNFQRPFLNNLNKSHEYMKGSAPHINVIPWPVMKSILSWEGCKQFELRHKKVLSSSQLVFYSPFLLIVYLFTWFFRGKRRRRYFLDETNGVSALLGGRHVLVIGLKDSLSSEGKKGLDLCR